MRNYALFYKLILTLFCLLCTACGQTGKLFLPGEGSGYYKQHVFTERPTTAAAPLKKTPKKHTKKSSPPSTQTAIHTNTSISAS